MIILLHSPQIRISSKLIDMKGQYDLCVTSANISQKSTIVPRLDYSNNLISEVISILKKKRSELKKSNKSWTTETENEDPLCYEAIGIERTVCFCLEGLYCIQKKMNTVSRIDLIPKIFPSMVPVIRTISAQLVTILPESSCKLSELSVHLGSIVLDSASITTAQFDFRLSNAESSTLLDEVKLIVDSKISKQYPHLHFLAALSN